MKNFARRIGLRPLTVPLALLFVACASSPPAGGSAETSLPADLAGEWGIQIRLPQRTVDGLLRFTAERNGMIGSFSDDEGNQSELSKLHIENGKISWEMDRKDGTLVVHGRIEGTIMSGKMKRRRSEDDAPGGGGTGPYGGRRRVGEPDSYSWTAIKRAAQTK